MSEATTPKEEKPRRGKGPPKQPRGKAHGTKKLPVIDVTLELDALDLDEESSKKNKLTKLNALRSKILKGLNNQQQEFVKEYFIDFNVSKAGIRAGYTPEYARGGELMKFKSVIDYIEVTRKINELKMGVTADFVLEEFNKLAKVKASDLYDTEGNLIPPHKLPDWVAAAISEVKQKTYTIGEGETQKTIVEFAYKLHSKVAALDALGKHTGIYERDNKQKTPPNQPQVVVYIPDNGRTAAPTEKPKT